MIKFREHRGSLNESMETLKIFKDSEELVEYLKKKFHVNGVKSRLYSEHNPSNGWKETHIITIDPGPGVLGFSDKPITTEPTEMEKWIKELEENAENFGHYKKGDLYLDNPIVTYFYKSELENKKDIFLSGSFSIADLQSLINHMKKYTKEG